MMRLLILFICLLFIHGSCSKQKQIIAEVGAYKITQKDINYRNKIIKLYDPKETRDLGLAQLTRAFSYAEILNSYGQSINEKMLLQEAIRIDKETQIPNFLLKIKSVFDDDHDAYLRIYVLPVLVERMIYYDFFVNNLSVHKESYNDAMKFLKLALKSTKAFHRLGQKQGLDFARFVVSEKTGLRPMGAIPDVPPSDEQAKRWITNVVSKLKPGEIFPEVVNTEEHWKAIRYVGPYQNKTNEHLLEAVLFKKISFDEWIKSEKLKIKVVQRN